MYRLRALLAWSLAATVALVTAWVVATDLATLHRRAGTLGPPTAMVVARHDLPLGAVVRRGDLDTRTLYRSAVPAGALHDTGDVIGRIVAVPLVEGAAVTDRHLASRERDGLDGLVAPGTRAVRVVTDDGLRPEPGALVDVLVSLDPSLVAAEGGGDPTVVVARAARVLSVDGTGTDESDGSNGFAAAGGPGVTLLVSEQEAHGLAFAAANGVLMLALAPPEDACCPDEPAGTDDSG